MNAVKPSMSKEDLITIVTKRCKIRFILNSVKTERRLRAINLLFAAFWNSKKFKNMHENIMYSCIQYFYKCKLKK